MSARAASASLSTSPFDWLGNGPAIPRFGSGERQALWPQERRRVPCTSGSWLCRESAGFRLKSTTALRTLRRRRGAAWHNASDVKLRNAHLAAIDRSKVLDYLLNEAHPDNGGKARFFALLGHSREDPERLMNALRHVAEHGEVVSGAESVHTQESRQWSVRTVWIIDRGKDAPRLVNAYPGKE